MATATDGRSTRETTRTGTDAVRSPERHLSTETKSAFKTTELIAFVAAVAGVLIASKLLGDGRAENGADYFAADKAWWYITLLTIGYMISRGLAKAGSRTRDADPRTR